MNPSSVVGSERSEEITSLPFYLQSSGQLHLFSLYLVSQTLLPQGAQINNPVSSKAIHSFKYDPPYNGFKSSQQISFDIGTVLPIDAQDLFIDYFFIHIIDRYL